MLELFFIREEEEERKVSKSNIASTSFSRLAFVFLKNFTLSVVHRQRLENQHVGLPHVIDLSLVFAGIVFV